MRGVEEKEIQHKKNLPDCWYYSDKNFYHDCSVFLKQLDERKKKTGKLAKGGRTIYHRQTEKQPLISLHVYVSAIIGTTAPENLLQSSNLTS